MRRVPHQDKLARTGIPNRISLREAWCQPSWWLSLCDLSVKSTPCRWCCWRKIGAEAFHGHQGTSLVVHRPTSYRFTSTYSTRGQFRPCVQSPCDVRMVPFPQCTFSLSTTIGPFGEGLERLSQDSLAAASQSLSCEGFSYLFISWAQDLELSRRSWLIIDQIASISCSIILDFSYCPPVMNNPSSGITSTTPSFLPGQQRKVITKCLSEGLHFTKLFWCVLQSPRWNVILRGSCSLNIKLILHAHSPAPLFLLPPAARPS